MTNNIKCEVPYCETIEKETSEFEHTNIRCLTCNKFTCSVCTNKIWRGEWPDSTFYKPKIIIPGVIHQVFSCPFCRASFDRLHTD